MDRQKVDNNEKELIKELSKYITFYENPKKQVYDEDIITDFATLQIEGVAMLLNRLNKFNIVLLADEVGMGKTFQALAVITEQFRQKPDSKVLVITPRKEVLNQWKEEEYKEFREKHFLNQDEKYLPENNNDNIHEIPNFAKGFFDREKPHTKIVFVKSTSFSTQENIDNIDREKQLLEDIKQFDLIVVDEAHKFRNYNEKWEDSLIIKTAKNLFGNINDTTKILLMTATPLHSRNGDFKRISNLFNIQNSNFLAIKDNEKELMKNIMVRRLRVMSNGQNKYTYRNEIAKDISLTNESTKDYKNELFFAMLQKEYAKSDNGRDLSKSKHLLDFLEGTGFDENFAADDTLDVEINTNKELNKILKKYEKAYGNKEKPSNNKYEKVLEEILNKEEKDIFKRYEKVLIFVRRTASAYELARQYINQFDTDAWNLINNAIDSKVNIKIPSSREEFEQVIKNYLEKDLDNEIKIILNNMLWEEQENKDLLNKFRKNSRNISDGKSYILTTTAKKLIVSEYFEKYEKFNQDTFINFLKNINSFEEETIIENDKVPKSMILNFFKKKKGIPSTHASRFLQKFRSPNSPYSKFFEEDFVEIYTHDKFIENNHNIRKLVKSAVLHSSLGLVELYCCDIEASKNKLILQYNRFKQIVKEKLKNNQLSFIHEVDLFLNHFDIYKKYLSFNENQFEDNDEESNKRKKDDESIFHDSQPAYPYVGNTKNKTIITRFNSPFFPKLLCGTSTLQEGVNLHLFCNKIYHFGAAHTMGDDEQRVGRVDRLMGKMDRELKSSKETNDFPTLDIYYPYLKSTFDEFNLKKMLCNKRKTEKIIDKGTEIILDVDTECNKNVKELLHNIKNKE